MAQHSVVHWDRQKAMHWVWRWVQPKEQNWASSSAMHWDRR
jgi:hypothetical protein